MWPFKRKPETRSQSFTAMAMQARQDWITGPGVSELSATVQGAVSLWENGLSLASTNARLLTPNVLALTARALALTGESVWLIDNELIPVDTFDLTTKNGRPTAYRVSVPDVGGGRTMTMLAGEVLHFRIGCNPACPWRGTSPLRRSSLSAGLLNALEQALADVYVNAPLGSQVVPVPESTEVDNTQLAASFRGRRGRVLLPESVNVTAAGGPTPTSDWKPQDLTPDLSKSMATDAWAAARHNILMAFGVLPALLNQNATGPVVREAQRHLAQWTLTPLANLITAEVAHKTLTRPTLDVASPLHAFDAGGRARALSAVVAALANAKEAGIDPAQVAQVAAFEGVNVT